MSIIRSGGGRPDRHLGHLRGPEYRGLPLDLRSGGGSASNSENINDRQHLRETVENHGPELPEARNKGACGLSLVWFSYFVHISESILITLAQRSGWPCPSAP